MARNKQITEYAVRTIDQHGDCIDVDHSDTEKLARENAVRWMDDNADGAVAVVVTKEVSTYCQDGERMIDQHRETLYVYGSFKALRAGSWHLTDEETDETAAKINAAKP